MAEFDVKAAEDLERKYDSGLQTRTQTPLMEWFIYIFSILFAGYHYFTAGFGTPVDYWHMGFHMSGVILLVFICYPIIKSDRFMNIQPSAWWRPGTLPLWDWLFVIIGIVCSLYIGVTWYGVDLDIFGIGVPRFFIRFYRFI